MNRAFSIGLTLLFALMLGGRTGRSNLTDGDAAGAGIGALLGLGSSTAQDEPDSQPSAHEVSEDEKPPHQEP